MRQGNADVYAPTTLPLHTGVLEESPLVSILQSWDYRTMTEITFTGDSIETVGSLPEVGSPAPAFEVVGVDLGEVTSEDLAGKQVILNIFPSIDTGVCATAARKFNEIASDLPDTTVVCISKDLPFALGRFCGAEGLDDVVVASAFRSSFGEDYGVTMVSGPLTGLLSRAVVVVNPEGVVTYTEQVPEITTEPDYDAVLAALK